MNLFSGLRATFLGQPDFPWENRRSHQRLRLRLPIATRQGHRQSAGDLLDLSSRGLRIHSQINTQPGEMLWVWPSSQVALLGRQRVGCQVAWCRPHGGRYQVGLRWSDPESWLQDLWRRIQPGWARRRHLRVLCQLEVKLSVEEEPQAWHGMCHDLSPGGCRLQAQAHLTPGQWVRLDFAALSLEGRIIHREGTFYHIRFGSVPCPRLRGLLLNLLEAQSPLCEEPLVDESLLPQPSPPSPAPPRACQPLARVPVPILPEMPESSGLPEPLPPLHRRDHLPDRNPSLWAARLLLLRR